MQAGVVTTTIAQTGANGNQGGGGGGGGSSNLQRFKTHDPPALKRGGEPMVGGHCF